MALVKAKPTSPGRRFVVSVKTPGLHTGGPFEGLVEKNPYEGDYKVGNLNAVAAWNSAQTGLVSDGMYEIEVLDEKLVKQYKFRIEVRVLQERSVFTTTTLILNTICPETVGII